MAAPVFLDHPSSLEHDTGPHPEQPARIVAIEREMEARDWLGFERRRSQAAERSVIQRIHPERHVNAIQELAAAGGGAIDADTVVSPGSFEAARHAVGDATQVVDLLLRGEAPFAASVHRPPGHHCETARPMGFCLFSNIALAAQHALEAHGAGRVMILDWDVHHGNGTEEIFRRRADVLFCSIHESPLYPGTGPAAEVGSGEGAGYTVNLPVPAGSGDAVFGSLVEHVAAPLARAYRPGLILVSAGFDAHREDPLADCQVTDEGFAAMAASVRRAAAEIGVPVGLVLEGGYALQATARSLAAVLEVFGGDGSGGPGPAAEVHPLAAQARTRLEAGSPVVAGGWPGS